MAKASLFLKKDEKSIDNAGTYPVYVRFSHSNTPRAFSHTPIRVKETDLDKKRKDRKFRLKPQAANSLQINMHIEEIESIFNNIISDCKRHPTPNLSASSIKLLFEQKYRPGKVKVNNETWTEVFDAWVTGSGRSRGTTKGYTTAKNKMVDFLTEINKSVNISDFTPDLMDSFVVWMFDKKEFEPAYIDNIVADFRLFLKKMYKKEKNKYNVHPEMLDYKPERPIKIPKKPAIFLTQDEAEILWKYEPETDGLKKVKDLYMIMHYSGLRPSDRHIAKSELVSYTNKDGQERKRIVKSMQKTNETAVIPVTDRLESILQKYNYEIPVVTDQYFNRALKDLLLAAELKRQVKVITYPGGRRKEEIKELWQVASAKLGRKSLVSRLISLDVSIKKIGSITGHKKPINTEPYIGLIDSDIDDAMDKAFN